MRSRLLAIVSGLVLAVIGVVVPASPASAHCGGHSTHPDLYNAGGISFKDGTRIRTHPHIDCTVLGLGFPGHGIDVHCATETGSLWLFVRNTTTGVNGWGRFDAFNYAFPVLIPDCGNSPTVHQLG